MQQTLLGQHSQLGKLRNPHSQASLRGKSSSINQTQRNSVCLIDDDSGDVLQVLQSDVRLESPPRLLSPTAQTNATAAAAAHPVLAQPRASLFQEQLDVPDQERLRPVSVAGSTASIDTISTIRGISLKDLASDPKGNCEDGRSTLSRSHSSQGTGVRGTSPQESNPLSDSPVVQGGVLLDFFQGGSVLTARAFDTVSLMASTAVQPANIGTLQTLLNSVLVQPAGVVWDALKDWAAAWAEATSGDEVLPDSPAHYANPSSVVYFDAAGNRHKAFMPQSYP